MRSACKFHIFIQLLTSQFRNCLLIQIMLYLNNLYLSLERYLPLYTISNTQRNRDTQCHHSGNFASRDLTFGQLKSSYFEECDGVQNSKWVNCWDMTLVELMSDITACFPHSFWPVSADGKWSADASHSLLPYCPALWSLLGLAPVLAAEKNDTVTLVKIVSSKNIHLNLFILWCR